MQTQTPPSLYSWLGGMEALVRLTTRFYERVPANPTLAPVFAHMNPEHAKHAQVGLGRGQGALCAIALKANAVRTEAPA